eukprot:TRINITY_DN60402_c0_g1_i1.p1 TRINITY_DN60402_c0_g1~~TRINITY_DN60402_c0_g1_i1.p1  ORF type:complete len:230 (+),score=14.20 TRINITY_DN60402_c0_g1_i1:29-718(+)
MPPVPMDFSQHPDRCRAHVECLGYQAYDGKCNSVDCAPFNCSITMHGPAGSRPSTQENVRKLLTGLGVPQSITSLLEGAEKKRKAQADKSGGQTSATDQTRDDQLPQFTWRPNTFACRFQDLSDLYDELFVPTVTMGACMDVIGQLASFSDDTLIDCTASWELVQLFREQMEKTPHYNVTKLYLVSGLTHLFLHIMEEKEKNSSYDVPHLVAAELQQAVKALCHCVIHT